MLALNGIKKTSFQHLLLKCILLPIHIYIGIYVCIYVCTHSYTNINTGTQTRKAMITLSLCVVIYMHQQQAKWAPGRSWPRVRWRLLSGQNRFKNHRFWAPRRPGVAPLRDPVPTKLHFFWQGFRTRACTDFLCKLSQERLFLQRQKSEYKRS